GVLAIGGVLAARESVLALLGKSPDLTHRLDIWQTVLDLGLERPIGGWGWMGYWIPGVPPYDDLLVFGGVTYYQAHNAWLDMFLQLGVLGVLVSAVLVLGAARRAWIGATESHTHPIDGLLPLALLVALVVQSFAESRLLVEWNLALLVTLAARGTIM